jgi:hypothetical protein
MQMTSEMIAHLSREHSSMNSDEFAKEFSTLLRAVFPNADETAHEEMELVGRAFTHWLTLLIDSRKNESAPTARC